MDKVQKQSGPAGALPPEEQARQKEMEARAAEIGRQTVLAAGKNYKTSLAEAAGVLNAFRENAVIDFARVTAFVRGVLFLFKNFNGSLLLENMQAAPFDEEYYPRHMVNVSLLNVIIWALLGERPGTPEHLAIIGASVDFGMLSLPGRIRDPHYRMNDNERVRMRQHPVAARRLLEAAGAGDEEVLNAVLHHHERYDGSGYPRGLKGEEIPFAARLTAVADSFDAAISRHNYGRRQSPFEILAEFARNPGDRLDPAITKAAVEGLADMLVGRHVRLSDSSIGEVTAVNHNNLAFPAVRVVGRIIQTGPELYPLSLTAYFPMG